MRLKNYKKEIQDFQLAIEPYIIPHNPELNTEYSTHTRNFGYAHALGFNFISAGMREVFKDLWKDKVFFVPKEDQDYVFEDPEFPYQRIYLYTTYVGYGLILRDKTYSHTAGKAFEDWKKEHSFY